MADRPAQAPKNKMGQALQPRSERPVSRTSEGLRDTLFDEIDKFRRGNGDAEQARVISTLVGKVVAVARLELEFARARKDMGNEAPSSLKLGNEQTQEIEGPAAYPENDPPPHESAAAIRSCLRCGDKFNSKGSANRLCSKCKDDTGGIAT